ncbi:DUF3243 domain-containing protein [Paenibacillus sp. GCM10023252]|uniref:DUF3243 domain-containing protein n=1 Tax=Paenibacillus sp. GCM10023252 TaxID=3252649 RepID=UPI0036203573
MAEYNHIVDREGQVAEEQVGGAMDRIGSDKKDEILRNFDEFRQYLAKRIQLAEKLGLSEEQLARTAEKVGDYLAANEEPRNQEEKLLQELWKAGNQEERHKLAHILVKFAQASA